MRPRFALCAAGLLTAAAAVAVPDDALPDGSGMRLPSGSSITTELGGHAGARDTDDYLVDVERGRNLELWFTQRGRPVTSAYVQVHDASGVLRALSTPGDDRRLFVPVEETGTLRIRVAPVGTTPDDATVPYALRVAVTGPTGVRVSDRLPDPRGGFVFRIPARGGARLAVRLESRGAAPRLESLVDPQGNPTDIPAAAVRTRGNVATIRGLRLPPGAAFGDWILTFAPPSTGVTQDASLTATVRGPRTTPRRGRLAALEPAVLAVSPSVASIGTRIRVDVAHAGDPRRTSPFTIRLGTTVVDDAAYAPEGQTDIVSATIPERIAPGTYDVVLETARGQVAVLPTAIRVVPPPVAQSFTPTAAPSVGGFEVTILGRDFRPGRMGARIDGALAPVIATSTATSVRFIVPASIPGEVALGVVDLDTQRTSDVGHTRLLLGAFAAIGSLSPEVVPASGGAEVSVRGFYFSPDDVLQMETDVPGTWDDVASAFVSDTERRFTPPARPPGSHLVRIRGADGRISRAVPLRTFRWADVTEAAGLGAAGALDATTTALADIDRDGDTDLILGRDATGPAAATPHVRILRNDGGTFSDATDAWMPATTSADDWRAARVRAADVTGDGWPDLVLGTPDTSLIPELRSHVRILRNEARSAAEPGSRVLRDRTSDLFPAPLRFSVIWETTRSDTDGWTARDLWIGDLDDGGPPEIVATTDRTFAAEYASCSPYCASPYGVGYTYGTYWGGTRVFRWNPAARGGLGRFRFDLAAMPHRRAPSYVSSVPPPGVTFSPCSGGACEGKFTPFTGRRLAIADLDADGRPDIVVVSDAAPIVSGTAVSALQVQLGRASNTLHGWGGDGTDVTPLVTALGIDLRGDALAAGTIGRADVPGAIAVGRSSAAAPGTGPGLRLLRWVPGPDGALGAFEDATDVLLGPPPPGESWWSSALEFADADGDGLGDIVVLGTSAPSGSASALRVLRGTDDGTLRDDVRSLLESVAGPGLAGSALAIGDLAVTDGSAAISGGTPVPAIVLSRATPAGPGAATRVLTQDP